MGVGLSGCSIGRVDLFLFDIAREHAGSKHGVLSKVPQLIDGDEGWYGLFDPGFAVVMGEKIAAVANSCSSPGHFFFREQRTRGAIFFVVPDRIDGNRIHCAEVGKVTIFSVDDAAGRDTPISINNHRAIEIEAGTWLIGLSKLLL